MKSPFTHTTRHNSVAFVITIICASFLAFYSSSFSATPTVVNEIAPIAWVSYPKNIPGDALLITRKGQRLNYNDQEGLKACDQVTLQKSNLQEIQPYVVITLANSSRIRLTEEQPIIKLPCDKPTLTNKLAAWLKTFSQGSDERYEINLAGSRSTEIPNQLTIPALVAESAIVSSENGLLHLRWLGGEKPYKVTLAPYDFPDRVAIAKSGIFEPMVNLPLASIKPGRYILTIKGSDERGVEENNLQIVKENNIPAMPSELVTAELPLMVKTLFYADYLISFEDGRFTLEALQQAASVAGRGQGQEVENWLHRWGGI